MTSSPTPNLDELASQLPTLLTALDTAATPSATVDDQAHAFKLGCSLLDKIVARLRGGGSELKNLGEQVEGFTFGLSKESFGKFLNKELELLGKLQFDEAALKRAADKIHATQRSLETPEKFNPVEAINAIDEFRQLLCNIHVYTVKEGMRFSRSLILTCADGIFDVALISADAIAVTVASTTLGLFPFVGVALATVASVRSGVKGLGEKIRQIKDRLPGEMAEQRQAKLKRPK